MSSTDNNKLKKQVSGSLEKVRERMPSEAERKQAARREGALDQFGPDDAAQILSALKKRALTGDVGAAKICLSYLIGGPDQKPASSNFNIENITFAPPSGVPKSLAKAREQIVKLIAVEGPLDEKTISTRTGLAKDVVEGLLDHSWFEDENHKWHVTNMARAEVMAGDDE